MNKIKILEVNNIDLAGRRFNGYDLQEEINKNTIHRAKQIVTYKESKNDKVLMFYNTNEKCWAEWRLMDAEANELAVHSQLSFTSNILKNNDSFINADIVHYHLIHNTKLSLYQMIELCSNKPSIWTFHDPWPFIWCKAGIIRPASASGKVAHRSGPVRTYPPSAAGQ